MEFTGKGSITVLGMRSAVEREGEFDAVITIENADGNLRQLRVNDGRPQLVLGFNDIDFDDGGPLVVTKHQIADAIAFSKEIEEGMSLLVHCHAGRCRSPAVALAILADRLGPGREEAAVEEMLRIAPRAAPNLVVLRLADQILGREGKLIAAWMYQYENTEEIARLRRLKREIYLRKISAL